MLTKMYLTNFLSFCDRTEFDFTASKYTILSNTNVSDKTLDKAANRLCFRANDRDYLIHDPSENSHYYTIDGDEQKNFGKCKNVKTFSPSVASDKTKNGIFSIKHILEYKGAYKCQCNEAECYSYDPSGLFFRRLIMPLCP